MKLTVKQDKYVEEGGIGEKERKISILDNKMEEKERKKVPI
jgi:hypothetical protein